VARSVNSIAFALAVVSLWFTACKSDDTKVLAASGSLHSLASVVSDGTHHGYRQDCLLELRYVEYNSSRDVAQYDVRDKNYGCMLFGEVVLRNVYAKIGDKYQPVILLFSRRGGDGDHTPLTLEAFKVADSTIVPIDRQEITDPAVINRDGKLRVDGFLTITFCNVCDSWEASEVDDIFHIPVSVLVNETSLNLKPRIITYDREGIIARFKQRRDLNLAEHAKRDGKKYADYVSSIEKRFFLAIGGG